MSPVLSILDNTNYMCIYVYHLFITVPLPCIVSDWSNWSAPDANFADPEKYSLFYYYSALAVYLRKI
jgi:hypothetical protein